MEVLHYITKTSHMSAFLKKIFFTTNEHIQFCAKVLGRCEEMLGNKSECKNNEIMK